MSLERAAVILRNKIVYFFHRPPWSVWLETTTAVDYVVKQGALLGSCGHMARMGNALCHLKHNLELTSFTFSSTVTVKKAKEPS